MSISSHWQRSKSWMRHYSHERADNQESYPSVASLCEKCNLNEKTVFEARRWLIDNGWLVKVGERRMEGRFTVPVFRVDHGTIPEEIRIAATRKAGHGNSNTVAQQTGHGNTGTVAKKRVRPAPEKRV
jgi:helix-turn-helix protein